MNKVLPSMTKDRKSSIMRVAQRFKLNPIVVMALYFTDFNHYLADSRFPTSLARQVKRIHQIYKSSVGFMTSVWLSYNKDKKRFLRFSAWMSSLNKIFRHPDWDMPPSNFQCTDCSPHCKRWASLGFCNGPFRILMTKSCRKSCNMCSQLH